MSGPPIHPGGVSGPRPRTIFIAIAIIVLFSIIGDKYPLNRQNLSLYGFGILAFAVICFVVYILWRLGKRLFSRPFLRKQTGPIYLIELRFGGYAKKYAKTLIWDVAKRFRVRGVTRKRVVPHVTLFGPFRTRNEQEMIGAVKQIGASFSLVPFSIKGFDYFDNKPGKVIYLDVTPSKELEELRWELSQSLLKTTETISQHDSKREFYFHATVAFKDIDRKFNQIWAYLKSKEEPNIKQNLLRITILKKGKILYEYDLMQKRLLNRREALSKKGWDKTIEVLKRKTEQNKFEDNTIMFS